MESLVPFDGEHFVDKEEHYQHLYLLEGVIYYLTLIICITIDSTYVVCVEQCVGLLKVVKLRLEVVIKQEKGSNSASYLREDVAREAIIKSADLHEKVLNFGGILESSYCLPFLFVMMTVSCTLITVSVGIVMNLHQPFWLIKYGILFLGLTIHIFYLSWPGQKLIEASEDIFYAAYDNEWYKCSVESQKFLKFIMQRSMEPIYLTAGGFYNMNFETFGKILKTTVSYITTIASLA